MTPSMALAGALALGILLLLLVSELRRRHARQMRRTRDEASWWEYGPVRVRIRVRPLRRSCWPRRHRWRGVQTPDGRDLPVWWCDHCTKVKHGPSLTRNEASQ